MLSTTREESVVIMPMVRRLTILAPLCFLAGLAGGAWFLSRSGSERADAPPAEGVTFASDHRAGRMRLAPAAERESVLLSLTPAGGWSGETKEALVLQLLADPGFINVIHARSPETPVLAGIFAALAETCPGHLWKVMERMDFDLPPDFPGVESMMTAMAVSPEEGFATLHDSPHVPKDLLRDLFMKAGRKPLMAGPLLEAVSRDPEFWAACSGDRDLINSVNASSISYIAIRTLINAKMEVPEAWRNDPDVQNIRERSQEWMREQAEAVEDGRDWAAQGFPLEKLKGASDPFLRQISQLVSSGKIPPPAVYEELIAQGHPEILFATLYPLVATQGPKGAEELLDEIQCDRSEEGWKRSYNDFVQQVSEYQPGNLQTLGLIDRIQDPDYRRGQTARFYYRWAMNDPGAVLGHLSQIEDAALREELREYAEKDLVPQK